MVFYYPLHGTRNRILKMHLSSPVFYYSAIIVNLRDAYMHSQRHVQCIPTCIQRLLHSYIAELEMRY